MRGERGWAAAFGLGYPTWASSCPVRHQGLLVLLVVILAQRMTYETFIEQDRAQVGIAAKDDAVHVMALALHELGRAVERYEGIDRRIRFRHARLQSDADHVRGGIEVIHDVEP